MVEAQTQIFRASLGAKVYRDFEVLSAKNLYDLAGAIVRFSALILIMHLAFTTN